VPLPASAPYTPSKAPRAAKLRHVGAAIEDIDYRSPRKLDKALMQQLATCRWIAEYRNLLITGPCGIGKTWLASALGQKACRDDHTVVYARVPRLFADLRVPSCTACRRRRPRRRQALCHWPASATLKLSRMSGIECASTVDHAMHSSDGVKLVREPRELVAAIWRTRPKPTCLFWYPGSDRSLV
jgi:hypothetical protein